MAIEIDHSTISKKDKRFMVIFHGGGCMAWYPTLSELLLLAQQIETFERKKREGIL